MSVRRLAEEALQPSSFVFSAENAIWAERLLGRYPEGRQQSAVIPLLMRAQEQEGWVTRAAVEHVADRLAMPLIRVLEVATFYTQFQLRPVGTKAHVQVCGTTPCMLRGAEALKDVCRKRIHADQFHINEAGTLSWEEVECLGACVNAPMVMVLKDTYEDLSPERLGEIIDALERGEAVKPGPQIDRHLSVPSGGLTTLKAVDPEHDAARREGGPADTSSEAPGSAAAASNVPSQAGRVDTHAAETDPTLRSPATERGAATDPATEKAASADPDAGAGTPGSGRVGGSQSGSTDSGEREAGAARAADGQPSALSRSGGGDTLPDQEGAAEAAVIDRKKTPRDGGGAQGRPAGKARAKTGAAPTEAERQTTDDTGAAAPAARRPRKKPAGTDGSESA